MLKFEKRCIELIISRKNFLFLLIVSCIGFLIRYSGRTFISRDMLESLLPWFDTIKQHGGMKALSSQVGNYNILYQSLVALMTYFDIYAITQYKVLSCIFDYALALSAALIVKEFEIDTNRKYVKFCLIYTIILILPEVFLNSAVWGQCDSIYTTFAILTILQLYKEKYISAFVLWGISLAFKLQAVFILPFLIFYYFYKRKFSFIYFLVSITVFWITGFMAFLQGRSLLDPFAIYLGQAGQNQKMWMNSISFWILLGNDYSTLAYAAVGLVIALSGVCLYLVMEGKIQIATPEEYVRLACWSVWTCYLFLPCMHERYTYMLDILLLILIFINKKYWFYFFISTSLSIVTYGKYLYGSEGITTWEVILYLFTYFLFARTIMHAGDRQNEKFEDKADVSI